MGQVPAVTQNANTLSQRILLIGGGRLARSLVQLAPKFLPPTATFRQLTHADVQKLSVPLYRTPAFQGTTHVWLALPDPEIARFTAEHLRPDAYLAVHFAGALSTINIDGLRIYGAHPLMTFTGNWLTDSDVARFHRTPFALSPDSRPLADLLPGLSNPTFVIRDSDRLYYHALCAIAGNFTVMLWETVAAKFGEDLAVDPKVLNAYREQIFANLASSGESGAAGHSVLTGPLARGDQETVLRQRQELLARAEPALAQLYSAFENLYRSQRSQL